MCGIFAASSLGQADIPVARALDAIRHRGPDDSGVFVSTRRDCHLGHVRLSVLDLSAAGHQPMSDASGRFVLSYNGETYNFRELRAELEARHGPVAWKSGSDTEVIVEGFAREGIPFLDRLNGIFALAIYDTEERVLHVLRDPIGIKPLFITEQAGGVYFCSELKGLLALPALKRTFRPAALAEQLAFMYLPEPYTAFEEFRKVEPGVCFSYREGKLLHDKRLFAHLQPAQPFASEPQAIEALQSAFGSAVKRQMIADVPVSLFLSGGLDSSAVAHQAVQSGATVKDAYTIAFSSDDRRLDAQSDDLHYAKLMAGRLGLELKVITASRDFLALLPKLIPFMEDGFSDPAAINTYLISAAARSDGVKVMLSGQGADEYLGGYRRYLAEKSLRRLSSPVRWALSGLDSLLPETLPGRFNALNRRVKRLASLAGQSPKTRIKAMYTWSSPETIRLLLRGEPASRSDADFEALLAAHEHDDVVDAMMAVDRQFDLMSLNLCYTDRMSMAVGVEARVPFLDFDLVRTMNAIPAAMKVKGRQGKHVFKKAMEPFLPMEIIYREKAGFGLPLRAWMRESSDLVGHYLDSARIEQQGLFHAAAVRRLLDEQFKGVKDHSNTLFTLLTQQMWLDAHNIR